MQGKLDIRTVGRQNRDNQISKTEDAISSPFQRSLDAVKPSFTKPVEKNVAVKESKKSIKKTDPPRRSARIHKPTKQHTGQTTLLDKFVKTQKESRTDADIPSTEPEVATVIPTKREIEQTEPKDALPAKKHCTSPTAEPREEESSNTDESEQPKASSHETTQHSCPIPTKIHQTPPSSGHAEDQHAVVEDQLQKRHPEEEAATIPQSLEAKQDDPNACAVLEANVMNAPVPPSDDQPSPASSEKNHASRLANWSAKSPAIEEKETLERLRNALDISLTFHAGHQRLALFHNIQPMLRNSTRKNITLSHISKILYLAPMLYHVTPKVLNKGRQALETYLIEFGKDWTPPLTGKELEQRKNLLAQKFDAYFAEHGEVLVPEKELPKNEKIVDSKAWLEKTNLPSGVRDMLRFEQQRKEDDKKREQEKKERESTPIQQTGTVKERRLALLERIRAKSQKK
ncbi:hypothetical protein BX666DRAFT_1897987 [Dichotomocladium elegans]|nr:hypothetical protein BX666DRAFT_1897987 [Dichotomocladium elegans]